MTMILIGVLKCCFPQYNICCLRLNNSNLLRVTPVNQFSIETSAERVNFLFAIFRIHEPGRTFVATMRPSCESKLWSLGLEDVIFPGSPVTTLLQTFPKAPRPSSSMIVTRWGGTSSNLSSIMSDSLKLKKKGQIKMKIVIIEHGLVAMLISWPAS